MTATQQTTRYARLRPEKRRHWPECYHGKIYRVLEQPHDVSEAAGYVWIATPWKEAQSVWAAEFELAEKRALKAGVAA